MPSAYSSSFEFFKVTFPANYVAHVEIDRAAKLNAFSDQMFFELKAVFDSLSTIAEVRCIMLSGSGNKAFSAGVDVQSLGQSAPMKSSGSADPSRQAFALRKQILDWQTCITAISECQKPVIALVHGIAFGLAIDISTACDIRLCAADSRFSVKEVDIGLAADMGTLSRLAKVIGGVTSWVKEICLTARTFTSEEALRVGFVSGILPNKEELLKDGLELAGRIASKSPVAVQGTKNILDASWETSTEHHLRYTAIWNAGMLQSTDNERAMASALKKKTAVFEKL